MSSTDTVPHETGASSEEIARVLANIVIPPCPRIVLAMVQEARADDPDLMKLDKLICGDMGLAAAVIKTANSPFYGLNHKVQAVRSALQVLGIRSVTSIVGWAQALSSGGKLQLTNKNPKLTENEVWTKLNAR